MNIKEITFSGIIQFDWTDEYKRIKLIDGDKSIDLVKKFRAVFELFESQVSVSYFISDEKKTEDEIKEEFLKKIFGDIYADYTSSDYYYSEWTFGTDYDTFLMIGGHDLFFELSEFQNKWCSLKINIK